MTKKITTAPEMQRRTRPRPAKEQPEKFSKRTVAVELGALRNARGLSRSEVAAATGMSLSEVARLESVSGHLPDLASIESYVDACGGHISWSISAEQELVFSIRTGSGLVLKEGDKAQDVVTSIEAWAGSRAQAVAWYYFQPLPAFADMTASEVVDEGHADALKAYIERLSDGGYS